MMLHVTRLRDKTCSCIGSHGRPNYIYYGGATPSNEPTRPLFSTASLRRFGLLQYCGSSMDADSRFL